MPFITIFNNFHIFFFFAYTGYDKGGCVVLATGRSLGLWEVKDCVTFSAKYICMQRLIPMIPLLPAARPTPSLNGSCPDGWNSAPNLRHCYKVNTEAWIKLTVLKRMFCKKARELFKHSYA